MTDPPSSTPTVGPGLPQVLLPGSEPLLLSVVIAAHDEEDNLVATVEDLVRMLDIERIPYELVIVDDNSSDLTGAAARELALRLRQVRVLSRTRNPGFGRAVRAGLELCRGNAVAIVMADRSEDPRDVVRYYRKLQEGYDCVFGSRFRPESRAEEYPRGKLVANRLLNRALQLLFRTGFNDLSNPFKAYRMEVVRACGPYASGQFSLGVEMALSALNRRYRIAEVPIRWKGSSWAAGRLPLRRLARGFLPVVLRAFLEKRLIADEMLEERLAEGRRAAGRVRALEERLGRVEAVLDGIATEEKPARSRAAADPDPDKPRFRRRSPARSAPKPGAGGRPPDHVADQERRPLPGREEEAPQVLPGDADAEDLEPGDA